MWLQCASRTVLRLVIVMVFGVTVTADIFHGPLGTKVPNGPMCLVNDPGDYIVTFVRGMWEAQHLLFFTIFCVEEAVPLCKLGEMAWLSCYFSQ